MAPTFSLKISVIVKLWNYEHLLVEQLQKDNLYKKHLIFFLHQDTFTQ